MTSTALIEGYASIFNTPDLNGDVVAPGAFAASLRAGTPVRLLYQHAADAPIGRWLHMAEDARGLKVAGELLLSSPRAREVHALLEGGALDGLSIGYETVRAARARAGRRILEARLWEISVVTFPMAPGARIFRVGAAEADSLSALAARFSETARARAPGRRRPATAGKTSPFVNHQ